MRAAVTELLRVEEGAVVAYSPDQVSQQYPYALPLLTEYVTGRSDDRNDLRAQGRSTRQPTRPNVAVVLVAADDLWPSEPPAVTRDLFDPPAEAAARDRLVSVIRHALSHHPAAAVATTAAGKLDRLTAREREILEHLIAGETSKEIARALGNSPRTVQVHRGRVLAKLSARNVADAVRIALEAKGSPQRIRS